MSSVLSDVQIVITLVSNSLKFCLICILQIEAFSCILAEVCSCFNTSAVPLVYSRFSILHGFYSHVNKHI